MANFYKSDWVRKIKGLQNNFNDKKTNYDLFREEAIKILNNWLSQQ